MHINGELLFFVMATSRLFHAAQKIGLKQSNQKVTKFPGELLKQGKFSWKVSRKSESSRISKM